MHMQTNTNLHNTHVFKITPEHLILARSLGAKVRSRQHLAHGHSIRGPFKAVYRTAYEILGSLGFQFKEQ